MLIWLNQFSIFLLLDSNAYKDSYSRYACLAGVGASDRLTVEDRKDLNTLQQWHDKHQDWLLGNICYDYKNQLETKLHSSHTRKLGFDDLYFFNPQVVCYINANKTKLTIETIDIEPDVIYKDILAHADDSISMPEAKLKFEHRVAKDTYLNTIDKLRQHIKEGDCYEINYCTEGYAEEVSIEPLQVFDALNKKSPAPFAAYYRCEDKYMMSASPERYLQKRGSKVVAQPIKGTARRGIDPQIDEEIKEALYQNIKERAENVMIVDLMRNDLARSCEVGSVKVEELFGIYSFPQVHQMISTISAQVAPDKGFAEVIKHSFPMGSMTGAPKIKVMELIEQYEVSRRELFSGTVGYITPGGDFDFNVIIRSLFYNATTQYLSYQTGGAITYDSVPEKEYEEMRLKAWALESILK